MSELDADTNPEQPLPISEQLRFASSIERQNLFVAATENIATQSKSENEAIFLQAQVSLYNDFSPPDEKKAALIFYAPALRDEPELMSWVDENEAKIILLFARDTGANPKALQVAARQAIDTIYEINPHRILELRADLNRQKKPSHFPPMIDVLNQMYPADAAADRARNPPSVLLPEDHDKKTGLTTTAKLPIAPSLAQAFKPAAQLLTAPITWAGGGIAYGIETARNTALSPSSVRTVARLTPAAIGGTIIGDGILRIGQIITPATPRIPINTPNQTIVGVGEIVIGTAFVIASICATYASITKKITATVKETPKLPAQPATLKNPTGSSPTKLKKRNQGFPDHPAP